MPIISSMKIVKIFYPPLSGTQRRATISIGGHKKSPILLDGAFYSPMARLLETERAVSGDEHHN